MSPDPFVVLDAVWRMESARIVAGVARVVRDVGLAEELAHDALVAALEQWPAEGVPDNPGAWLAATARHRAIDPIRRDADARAQDRGARPRRGRADRARPRRRRRRPRRGRRRRRPRAALRALPPRARPRVARGADPAAVRRPDHRRDRPGAARRLDDGRAADLAGEAAARRAAGWRSRSRRATELPPGSGRSSRSSTWSSTRATRPPPATTGCARRCARRRCGSAASSPRCCPTEPEVHGLRRAHGAAGLAAAGPDGARRRAGAARRPGPRRGGTTCSSAAGSPGWPGRRSSGRRRPVHAAGRDRGLSTPAPAPSTRPTGPLLAALYARLAARTPSPVVELNRAVVVGKAYGPGGRARHRRPPARRPGPAPLPPAARRAGRPAHPARAHAGGRDASSSGRRDGLERGRTPPAAPAARGPAGVGARQRVRRPYDRRS